MSEQEYTTIQEKELRRLTPRATSIIKRLHRTPGDYVELLDQEIRQIEVKFADQLIQEY